MSGLKIAPGLTLPEDSVTQTFGILAKRGAGKSNAGAVMAEEMHGAGLQFVAVDPVGAWWGLRSSSDGKGPGLPIPVLGGYHGDVPLEARAGELIGDLVVEERLSCVLDVSAFGEGEKKRFLADFAERMFRQKGKPGHEEPLHLFLEEADDYAPQGGTRGGDIGRCLGAFQRIVKQGRARGLGSTMITQRSAALNKDLLTQIDTLIVLRTTSPNDRKAIDGWVTYHDTDSAIIASLSELKAGEAWVWSPEYLDLVKRVQIRRRATFDSGATPKAGAKRRAPATLADVDLGALELRMRETIERAKAEDPRELRRQIAELEEMVRLEKAARDVKEVAVDVEEARVEVPVLSPEVDTALRALANGVAERIERIGTDLRQSGNDLMLSGDELTAVAKDIGETSGRVLALKLPVRDVEPQGRRPVGVGVVTPARRPQVQGPTAPRPSKVTQGDALSEDVTKPQQRILDALAWLESVRIASARKVQLAILAHQSPKSSGYGNNLGALRTAGLIEYPSGGVVALTDVGRAIASAPGSPPRNEDLWRTLEARLAAPQWRILWALIERYPASVGRDELAESRRAVADVERVRQQPRGPPVAWLHRLPSRSRGRGTPGPVPGMRKSPRAKRPGTLTSF